jgi:hypothetical protein
MRNPPDRSCHAISIPKSQPRPLVMRHPTAVLHARERRSTTTSRWTGKGWGITLLRMPHILGLGFGVCCIKQPADFSKSVDTGLQPRARGGS